MSKRYLFGDPVTHAAGGYESLFERTTLAATTMQSSVTQYGITWTFDQAYPVFQFANGDYGVVAPSGLDIIDIDPLSEIESGRTRHGSMVNPHAGVNQGYDSAAKSATYSASSNAGRPGGNTLNSGNPLSLSAGDSLVSGKSGEPADRWQPGQLDDAAVLTIVSEAPLAGSFRPPYTNGSKAMRWNVSDINWAALEAKQVARSRLTTLPTLSTILSNVERPWIDHGGGLFCHVAPINNMPDYGRDFQKRTGDAALTLLLDYDREDLRDIMYGYLQLGIDLFGLAEQGQTWGADGGIFCGRKMPILFAGWLFDNAVATDMLAIADASQNFIFQEDQQHEYVDSLFYTQCYGGTTCYTSLWNSSFEDMMGYPEYHVRMSQWRTQNNTYNPYPGWDGADYSQYTGVNIGKAGMVLAAHIAGLKSAWNWDVLFDYVDRVYASRLSGTTDPYGQSSLWATGTNGLTQLAVDMWAEFRAEYGGVWEAP